MWLILLCAYHRHRTIAGLQTSERAVVVRFLGSDWSRCFESLHQVKNVIVNQRRFKYLHFIFFVSSFMIFQLNSKLHSVRGTLSYSNVQITCLVCIG